MSGRRSAGLAGLAVLAATTVAASVLVSSSGAAGSGASIPVIADGPSYTAERDMPQAVQERLNRAALGAWRKLHAVAKLKPSRAAGCRPNDYPHDLGPPAPKVRAAVFGQYVSVVVRFDTLPRSPVCRPWGVRIATLGPPSNPKVKAMPPWAGTYELKGPTGRAVIRIPPYGKPPYILYVKAGTIQGRISKQIKLKLRCPRGGCLDGDEMGRNPQRHFALRNINRRQLERSFTEAIDALARSAPYLRLQAHCPNLTNCNVTYTDPLYPKQPYKIRYTISGEQTASCWHVEKRIPLNAPPYEDLLAAGPEAGCVTWPN